MLGFAVGIIPAIVGVGYALLNEETGLVPEITATMSSIPQDLAGINKQLETLIAAQEELAKKGEVNTSQYKTLGRRIALAKNEQVQMMIDDSLLKASASQQARLGRLTSPATQKKLVEMLGHPEFLKDSQEFKDILGIFAGGNKEYQDLITSGDYVQAYKKMFAEATGAKPNIPRAQKLYDALSTFYNETVTLGNRFTRGPAVAKRIGAPADNMIPHAVHKDAIIDFLKERNLDKVPEGQKILEALMAKGPGEELGFQVVQSHLSGEFYLRYNRPGDRAFLQHAPADFSHQGSRFYRSTAGSARVLRGLSTPQGIIPADLIPLKSAVMKGGIQAEDIDLFNKLLETRSGSYQRFTERYSGTKLGEIHQRTVVPVEAFDDKFLYKTKEQQAVVSRLADEGYTLIRSSKRAYTQVLENLAKNKVEVNPENVSLLKELGIGENLKLGLWQAPGGQGGDILKTISESVLKEQSNLVRSGRNELHVMAKAGAPKLVDPTKLEFPEFNLETGYLSNQYIEHMNDMARMRLEQIERVHKVPGLMDALEADRGFIFRGDAPPSYYIRDKGLVSKFGLDTAAVADIEDLAFRLQSEGLEFTQENLIKLEQDVLKYRNLGRTLGGSGASALSNTFIPENVERIAMTREIRNANPEARAVFGKEAAPHIQRIRQRFLADSKAANVSEILEDHFTRSARARANFQFGASPAEIRHVTEQYFKQFGAGGSRAEIVAALRGKGARGALKRLALGAFLPGEAVASIAGSRRLERVSTDWEVGGGTVEFKPGGPKAPGYAGTIYNDLVNQRTGIRSPANFGVVLAGESVNRVAGEEMPIGEAMSSFIQDLKAMGQQESATILEETYFDKGKFLLDAIVPEAENDPGLVVREQMNKNLRTSGKLPKEKYWATRATHKATIVDTLTGRLGTHMNFSKEAVYAMRASGLQGMIPYILGDLTGFDIEGYKFVEKMSESARNQIDTMPELKAITSEDIIKGKPFKGMGTEEFGHGWKYQSQLTKDTLDTAVEKVKDVLSPEDLKILRGKVAEAKSNMVPYYYSPGEKTGLKDTIAKVAKDERMTELFNDESSIHIPDIDKTIRRVARSETDILRIAQSGASDKRGLADQLMQALDRHSGAARSYIKHPVLNPFTKHGVLDKYGKGIKKSFRANIRLSEIRDITQATKGMPAAEIAKLSQDPVATITTKMARKVGISRAEIQAALKNGGFLKDGMLVGYRDPLTHVAAFRTRIVKGKGEGFVRISMGPTQMAMADFDKDVFAFKYISSTQQTSRAAAEKAIEEAFANLREFYAKVKPLAGKFKDTIAWSPEAEFYKSFSSELEKAKGTLEGEWRATEGTPQRKALMEEVAKVQKANPEIVGDTEQFAKNQFMQARFMQRAQKVLLGQATIPFASQTRRLMESLVYASGNYSQATLRAAESIGVNLQQIPIKEYKHGSDLEKIERFSEEMKETRALIGSPDPEKIRAGFQRIGQTQYYQGIIRENLGLAKDAAVTPEHIQQFFTSEKTGNIMGTLTEYAERAKGEYANVTAFTNQLIGREGNIMGKIRRMHGSMESMSFEEMRGVAGGQGHKFPGVGRKSATLVEDAVGSLAKVKSIGKKIARHPAVAIGVLGSIATLGLAGALQSPTNSAPLIPPSPIDKAAMGMPPMSLADKRYDMSAPPSAQRKDDDNQGSIRGSGVGPQDVDPNAFSQKIKHAYPNNRVNISVQHHPGGGPSVRSARRIKGM